MRSLLAAAIGLASGWVVIDIKSDIASLVPAKFDSVIGKFRDSQLAAVWLYSHNSSHDTSFVEHLNAVARDTRGICKVFAVDCDEYTKFCKGHSWDSSKPHLQVFPLNPLPAYRFAGDVMDQKKVGNHLKKLLPNLVTTFDDVAAFNAWRSGSATKPRVVLFSEKKAVPTILKAMAADTVFKRTISFGLVSKEQSDLVAAFKPKVKKYPSLYMVHGGEGKVDQYKGDLKLEEIQDWVNLFSESGMGDKLHKGSGETAEAAEEAAPWLVQDVPELHAKSAPAICLKKNGLCAVYMKHGALTGDEEKMLVDLKAKFAEHSADRGAVALFFMWLDLDVELELAAMWGRDDRQPTFQLVNPHNRLRAMGLGDDDKPDAAGVAAAVEKIQSGNARFKRIKGGKLPFVVRKETTEKEGGKRQEL